MKVLIIYDSLYGNTQRIAQAIGDTLGSQEQVDVLRADRLAPETLQGVGLLVVGSPTQRFRSTPVIANLLKKIPKDGLTGVKVAAFDTRLTANEIEGTPVLPYFVKIFGYAAEPIADALVKKGGILVLPAEGFYVQGMEGPLVEGEIERATDWAKQLVAGQ